MLWVSSEKDSEKSINWLTPVSYPQETPVDPEDIAGNTDQTPLEQ